MKRKGLVSAIAVAGAIVGSSVALAPAASADETATICGSSYHTVYGPYSTYTNTGTFAGNVYISYNSSNGYNCAYSTVSAATKGYYRDIVLESQAGDSSPSDSGYFNSFAGPVYLRAPGKCVKAAGYVTTPAGSDDWFDTGWHACG